MAFSLESERPQLAAFPTNPVRVVRAWVAAVLAKRARRAALTQLLELDCTLMDDIGIDRATINEALRRPDRRAGRLLDERRARAARDWLSRS